MVHTVVGSLPEDEHRIQYGTPYAIAVYILACAILSLVATAMMRDHTGKALSDY